MEALIDSFLAFLLLYKYAGLFCIAFIAAFAVPIPASTALLAAGAFAAQGYLNPLLVFLAAFFGNIAGDAAGFLLAKRYGQKALTILRLDRFVSRPPFVGITDYVLRFSSSLIYFSRFLTSVGPTVNVLSALSKVPARTFFIFDVLGEASYVTLYGGMGYFLGSQWENNFTFALKAGSAIATLGIITILFHTILAKRRK